MMESIQQRIVELLRPVAENRVVSDVRIGLGYTGVRLDDGKAGVAWTAKPRSGSCTHLAAAGTLAGRPAAEVLDMLGSPDQALARSVGLAAANALAAEMPGPKTDATEILKLIDLRPSDHVVMVGYFSPLIARIRETGCRLDIVELKEEIPDTLTPEEGRRALAACSVALITGTSLVTSTADELLASLGNPRAAVILGPSTFLRPEAYAGTKVTHLAGALVRDAAAVERIVSEGGGTMLLKKHMDFVTVCLKS